MPSGFTNNSSAFTNRGNNASDSHYQYSEATWRAVPHMGSGRFEFFRARIFGALHFVKRPALRYVNDLQSIESLRKEFNIGYTLDHPNIVKYLRLENNAVFEEYVDGKSLQNMIYERDPRLKSPQFIASMCRQLLEATHYLHIHGVVHNDIKPDNIMITRIGNQLKLVDLGGASSSMWDSTEGYTAKYKAPEQGHMPTNVGTDIFLVGKLMEHISEIAGVKEAWRNFIERATAMDISARFSDQEALKAIPKDAKPTPPPAPADESKDDDSGCWWWGLVALLLMGAMGYGVYKLVVAAWDWGTDRAARFLVPYLRSEEAEQEDIRLEQDGSATLRDVDRGTTGSSAPQNDLSAELGKGKALTRPSLDELTKERYEQIDRTISTFMATQFKKRVFPKCRVYARMPDGEKKDVYGAHIDTVMKSILRDGTDISIEVAKPYGENEYYHYALARFKAAAEREFDIADSIKHSLPE